MLLKPADLEINPSDPFAEDAFDRKDVVLAFANLLSQVRGPFVVALDSPWGTGKTTFLKMLGAHLRNEGFSCVDFNAWETDFAEDPLIAFVGEMDGLIKQICPNESESIDLWEKTKTTAAAVAKRSVPAVVKVATFGAIDIEAEIEKVIADTAGSLASDTIEAYLKEKATITEFRAQIDETLSLAEKLKKRLPVIIFVDELDRCRPLYAIELLERIKHLFNIKNAIFVLAVDKGQLGISLSGVYGQGFNSNEYLRRFFDLEFKLATVENSRFCESLINRMGLNAFFAQRAASSNVFEDEASRVKQVFCRVSSLLKLSPRAQESLMTLLATAMLTTPKEHHICTEVITLLAGLKVSGQGVYEQVARGQASIMKLVEFVQDQVPENPDDSSNFRELMIAAILATKTQRKAGVDEFLQLITTTVRDSDSYDHPYSSYRIILDFYRHLRHKSSSLDVLVKRIDLAAQFSSNS